MSDRGKIPLLRDPAYAVAAAKCWLARTESPYGLGAFHPEECGFCEIPLETLIASLGEFGSWSGITHRPDHYDPLNPTMTSWRSDVENFVHLPPADQEKLVKQAQGYLAEEDDGS